MVVGKVCAGGGSGVVGEGEYGVYGHSNGVGKCGAVWRGPVGTVEDGCTGDGGWVRVVGGLQEWF